VAHKKNQNTPQAKTADETQKDVESIARDIDFKPYLEAMNTASSRTRSVIFVLIGALLVVIAAFRDTSYPDWTDARLAQMQLASACIKNHCLEAPDCKNSLEYAESFVFQGDNTEDESKLLLDQEFSSELDDQIKEFIRQRTEAMTLHLPFFGVALDMNDLGLVGGLFLASILYVLYACLSREIDNIERVLAKARRMKGKIKQDVDFRDNLELLLMTQVFASPSRVRVGVGRGIYALFLSVPALHFFIVYTDSKTFNIAATLEGLWTARFEMAFEWIAFALVAFCAYLCWRQQVKLNQRLDGLLDSF
jgi:hypothetical protein